MHHINTSKTPLITSQQYSGNIVIPLRFPEFFFDDVLVNMIIGYTKFYSHREKAGISFEITNEKIRSFLSMLLHSGCLMIPDCKTYWEKIPRYFRVSKV